MANQYTRKYKIDDEEDFIEKALICEDDSCLIWPYGQINSSNGNYAIICRRHRVIKVSRLICEKIYGKPNLKDEAAHSCAVTLCVNKKHLRWATHQENMIDRSLHGNTFKPFGELNGMWKSRTIQHVDLFK